MEPPAVSAQTLRSERGQPSWAAPGTGRLRPRQVPICDTWPRAAQPTSLGSEPGGAWVCCGEGHGGEGTARGL